MLDAPLQLDLILPVINFLKIVLECQNFVYKAVLINVLPIKTINKIPKYSSQFEKFQIRLFTTSVWCAI